MKKKLLISSCERQLLHKRGIIETVMRHLKHCYQVGHTRYRSILNALTHLVAALAAYAIEPLRLGSLKIFINCTKKPTIGVYRIIGILIIKRQLKHIRQILKGALALDRAS